MYLTMPPFAFDLGKGLTRKVYWDSMVLRTSSTYVDASFYLY